MTKATPDNIKTVLHNLYESAYKEAKEYYFSLIGTLQLASMLAGTKFEDEEDRNMLDLVIAKAYFNVALNGGAMAAVLNDWELAEAHKEQINDYMVKANAVFGEMTTFCMNLKKETRDAKSSRTEVAPAEEEKGEANPGGTVHPV